MKESVSKGTNSLEVIFNGIFWIIDQVPITSKPSNTRAAVKLNGANMFRPNLKKTPLPLSFPCGFANDAQPCLVNLESSGARLSLKHHNEDYALHRSEDRVKTAYPMWLGPLPIQWAVLRGILIGRVSRAYQLNLTPVQVYELLDLDCRELPRLGFPKVVIRKLIYSLPGSIPGEDIYFEVVLEYIALFYN